MSRTDPASISRWATTTERRLSLALIGGLTAATIVALAYHSDARLEIRAFIPLFVGSTGTADALAAALLLSLYRIEGHRALLYAGAAYVLTTLLIAPYALTFPGVFTASGFAGNGDSAAWLWLVWHVGFAIMIMYGMVFNVTIDPQHRWREAAFVLAAVALVAAAATVAATSGSDRLPKLLLNGRFSPLFRQLAGMVSLTTVVALAVLLRKRPLSTLQLWLIVALAASALDTLLNAIAPARYSASWYVGKAEQFVTASSVLLSMLAAWAAINAQSTAFAQRLARTLDERRLLHTELEREQLASMAFQRAALPMTLPALPGVAFAAVYRAAGTDALVGGDWYDAFRLTDGRLVLSVGDVMGSGLASAVTMNAARQAVRGAAQIYPDPIVILDAVDRVLRSERPDTIVTALVAVFDPITLALSFASAGHPAPLLRCADGSVRTLGTSGLPLGLRSPLEGISESVETITLPDPSLLVLYTDGLTEARRDIVEGERRLHAVLADANMLMKSDPAGEIANAMLGDAALQRTDSLDAVRDDIAILTMRLDGVLFAADSDDEFVAGARWTLASNDAERAARTRREISQALHAAGATGSQVVTAELIYSELVGNVLRHSGSLVDIVLDLSGAAPALHVLDRGPGFTYSGRLPTSMMSESGRGLFIVSALAHDFSVVQRVGGGSHACAVLPFELRLTANR